MDTAGPAGAARTQGMVAILARTMRAWLKDDAGDLSRTMATLDRALRDVESWKERVSTWTRGAARGPAGAGAARDEGESEEPAERGS